MKNECVVDKWKELISQGERNLGGGILRVDDVLNHRIFPKLMRDTGTWLTNQFKGCGATIVLTAEISGIAPAVYTAEALDVPLLFARKSRPITIVDAVFLATSPSHTKGEMVTLLVSSKYLGEKDSVLIIDDFLASGATIMALARLSKEAKATIVGVGAVIEKLFEGGRNKLDQLHVPVVSVVTITDMSDGRIIMKD